VPHRVLRTDLVDDLEKSSTITALPRALKNAVGFKRFSGLPWSTMVKEGLAMRKSSELSWAQVLMAANTPMLLKAALVDGHVESGVMASGQAVGVIDDLPPVAELMERIVAEARDALGRLGAH
jgi:NAD(P)H-dependent flavin oxidoreductase YrpB (nitropropane dioxygenase family)